MAERIAILGSTGSIGTQALEVISKFPDRFSAEVLVAGNNYEILARQALQFNPDVVVIGNTDHYKSLRRK
jgi:1-deoxy-D-xylulose-5-phosphate reductoisomerase